MKSLRHPVRPICIDQGRPAPGDEDILHRSEHDEVRPDPLARRQPAIESDQRVDHPRRSGELRGPPRALEFRDRRARRAPGKAVRDVRLILAQNVDAKHAVLEQRVRHRAQMMNADQQGRLRRIRRDRDHRRHRDAVPARRPIGGHDIDRTRGMAHADAESAA